jgi:hypothetical protein
MAKSFLRKVSRSASSALYDKEEPESSLGKFLAPLLNDVLFIDVNVVCQDKVFSAHKIILAGRSEVFKTMLAGQFKEAKESKIEITSFEPRVVELLLEYIYKDAIAEEDVTWELFHAAKMYELDGLAKLCLTSLRKSICVDNCCAMLESAFLYELEIVFEFAVRFVRKNKKQVAKTEAWSAMKQNHELMAKICLHLM